MWSVKQITFWYGIKAEKSYCRMQSSVQWKKYKEKYSLLLSKVQKNTLSGIEKVKNKTPPRTEGSFK